MDAKIFNLFRMVCKEGSISVAARQLGMTQQGVSAALKRLDAEIGVPLVIADQSGTRPTKFGEMFLKVANTCADALESFDVELARVCAQEGNTLRVACTAGLLEHIGKETVEGADCGADVHLEVFRNAESAEEALLAGKVDLAIMPAVGKVGIVSNLLLDDPFYIWVPQDSPLAQCEELYLADLQGQTVSYLDIDATASRHFVDAFTRCCSDIALMPLTSTLRIYEMAVKGSALGLIDQERMSASGLSGVVAVPLVDYRLRYYLCRNADEPMSEMAQRYFDSLRACR